MKQFVFNLLKVSSIVELIISLFVLLLVAGYIAVMIAMVVNPDLFITYPEIQPAEMHEVANMVSMPKTIVNF